MIISFIRLVCTVEHRLIHQQLLLEANGREHQVTNDVGEVINQNISSFRGLTTRKQL